MTHERMPAVVPRRLALPLLCVLTFSCARQGGPETFPVTGLVIISGQPVPAASVSFEPVDGGEGRLSSQAVTDAEGRFSLQTHIGNNQFKDGLPPGEYGVAITKLETVTDMRRQPKNLLPRKFSATRTSGLTATVEARTNDFEFSLD